MAFIQNYIQNTAMNMLATGITAVGGMAGNAVGGVGTLIESGGRAVGDGVEGFVRKGGNRINAVGDYWLDSTATQDGRVKKTTAAAPSAASHSTSNISSTPSSAKKLISNTSSSGTKTLSNTATSASRAATNAASGATKSASNALGSASKSATSAGNNATRTATNAVNTAGTSATRTASGAVNTAGTSATNAVGGALGGVGGVIGGGAKKSFPAGQKALPKPASPALGAKKDVKPLPSPAANQAGKVRISKESRPGAAGLPSKPAVNVRGGPQKPGAVMASAARPPTGAANGAGNAGKVKISAESRPKPAGPGLKR